MSVKQETGEVNSELNQKAISEAMDRFEKIGESAGIKHSVWSMYEVTDLTEVPYPDARVLSYQSFNSDEDIQVPLKENATWLDLWLAADNAIEISEDLEHKFIELLELEEDIVVLVTGSYSGFAILRNLIRVVS